MPLKEGKSDEVISHNIKMLMAEGMPRERAVAAALKKAGKIRNPKKKES